MAAKKSTPKRTTKRAPKPPVRTPETVQALQSLTAAGFAPEALEQAEKQQLNLAGIKEAWDKYGPIALEIINLILRKLDEYKKPE